MFDTIGNCIYIFLFFFDTIIHVIWQIFHFLKAEIYFLVSNTYVRTYFIF